MTEMKLNLRLFDANVQTTLKNSVGSNDLSPEMKTFYDKVLIKNAVPNLVHDQFGQKKPIPKGGGKTIEFRKYSPFAKATTPITEGVTPDGHSLNVTTITATVAQYGDYVTLSDVLILTAIDDNIVAATELLGNQAGETLDWVVREKISAGTNVVYANGRASRAAIVTSGTIDKLTVNDIKRAVKALKKGNAQKFDNYYVGIVCPETAYDIMCDSEWIAASEYAGSGQIFEGEIGKIAGVRFVETTEAKVFKAEDLASDSRTLAVNYSDGYSTGATSIAFDGGTVAGSALVGRKILIGNYTYEVTANTTSAITLKSPGLAASVSNDAVIYPGEAGAGGGNVYSTLIIGANAYGVTEVEGGGLQQFTKQLGSAGTADPLDQRATVGWKAMRVAEILTDAFMVRIESAATEE